MNLGAAPAILKELWLQIFLKDASKGSAHDHAFFDGMNSLVSPAKPEDFDISRNSLNAYLEKMEQEKKVPLGLEIGLLEETFNTAEIHFKIDIGGDGAKFVGELDVFENDAREQPQLNFESLAYVRGEEDVGCMLTFTDEGTVVSEVDIDLALEPGALQLELALQQIFNQPRLHAGARSTLFYFAASLNWASERQTYR